MTNVICGRITREFRIISSLFDSWKEQSTEWYVYEHQADEKINRTHCHFLFVGSQATVKNLKERDNYKLLELDRTDHAYKTWDADKGDSYITYMTKGLLKPMLCNNMKKAEEARSAWKEKTVKKKLDKQTKDNYFDLCMSIRDSCTMEYIVNCKDDFGNNIIETKKTIRSFDEVYNKLLSVLDDNKIRTSEYDIDRWLATIVRNDSRMGSGIRDRMRKKYWDNV